jgi:gas vesicle protein
MSSNDPDQLRAEIERTRSDLSQNVNALGEAVTPGNIAKRQVDKVAGAAVGLKDKVMGTVDDATSSAADTASDRVGEVKDQAARKARGNPMAAGLIALGAGWLLGSLLPASDKERELAAAAKEKAQPMVDEVKNVAQEAAENLKEPAQQAAESLKATAQDAVETVKAEGQQATETVKASAAESADSVKEHQQRPDTSL